MSTMLRKKVKSFSHYCIDRIVPSRLRQSVVPRALGNFVTGDRNLGGPVVEILQMPEPLASEEEPLRFALETTVVGNKRRTYTVPIHGWVISSFAPAADVEVFHQGQFLRRTPVNVPRPDLARRLRGLTESHTPGFHTEVGVLGMPPECSLDLVVVLADGSRRQIGSIRVRHETVRTGFTPTLHPIMITCRGRSGSTWLMRLLSEHPQIVLQRSYPYETRMAIYWMHMLKVLAEPADHQASSHPDTFVANMSWVGHHPFYFHHPQWFGRPYVEKLAEFCQQNIERYYEHLADQQGQINPASFAEKHHPLHTPWMLWELYERAREVFLVRDARDMICSVLAFNAKRGYEAFGRQADQSIEDFIQQVGVGTQQLLDIWRQRSHLATLVRYEDLIVEPVSTMTKLLEYLGLDGSPGLVRRMIKRASKDTRELQLHRTSQTVGTSIGRWHRDLSPEHRDCCQAVLRDALEGFGYEV